MRKRYFDLIAIASFLPYLLSCDTQINNQSDSSEIISEERWEGLNYYNNKALPELDNNAVLIDNSSQTFDEKTEAIGLLENYAMENNLTGLILYEDGGYVKYSDRIQFFTNPLKNPLGNDLIVSNTKRHDYIPGYGFGVLSEGNISNPLTNSNNVSNYYSMYYHTNVYKDFKTLNYRNDKSEVVMEYYDYVSSCYFSTMIEPIEKKSYIWYASLATNDNKLSDGTIRPLPLDDNDNVILDANKDTLSNKYRVYVKVGDDAKYNLLSDKEELAAFKGRTVELEDYITPFKQLHNQSNKMARYNTNLYGNSAIKGLQDYYDNTNDATNIELANEVWENANVGVKSGIDFKGSYIDFTFNNLCSPYYAMFYLSDPAYCPVPQDFLDVIGGIANWGTFVKDSSDSYKYTPVDTTLSIGPYVVEKWNEDDSIIFKENELLSDYINGGTHRYTIDGIHVKIMPSIITDPLASFTAWQNGEIDYCTIPTQLISSQINTKGTQQTKGSSTAKLNINSCDSKTWEYLFGENGTIIKTPKDKYWDLEPAMSNDDFIKGLNLAINRKEYAEKRGVTPSISFFSSSYLINNEDGYSYNNTDSHKKVLLDYYGSESLIANYGYDRDLAITYFNKAIKDLIQSDAYKDGDVITIEMCWQSEEQLKTNGIELELYLEDVFNDPSVCKGIGATITLDVQNTFASSWKETFYNKMMIGQFDICFGNISGSSFNLASELSQLQSNNFSGFTLSWGEDTNSTEKLILYKDRNYTYDALCQTLMGPTFTKEDGSETFPVVAMLRSNEYNNDNTRTIKIEYNKLNSIADSSFNFTGASIYYFNSNNLNTIYESLQFIDNNDDTITIYIPESHILNCEGTFKINLTYNIDLIDNESAYSHVLEFEIENRK